MTQQDTITTAQRRKLFYIFSQVGFDDDARHDLVLEWTNGRTNSLSGLTFIEAQQMIRNFDEMQRHPQQRVYDNSQDIKRKGVIRAIFAYLDNCGIEANVEYVKGIALRASGMAQTGDINHDFNRISGAALTRIYNEFCSKQHIAHIKHNIPLISLN